MKISNFCEVKSRIFTWPVCEWSYSLTSSMVRFYNLNPHPQTHIFHHGLKHNLLFLDFIGCPRLLFCFLCFQLLFCAYEPFQSLADRSVCSLSLRTRVHTMQKLTRSTCSRLSTENGSSLCLGAVWSSPSWFSSGIRCVLSGVRTRGYFLTSWSTQN